MQETTQFDFGHIGLSRLMGAANESIVSMLKTQRDQVWSAEPFFTRMHWDQIFGNALPICIEESLEFEMQYNLPFAEEVRQQWVDIAELHQERKKLRTLSDYLGDLYADCELWLVAEPLLEQKLTQDFLALGEDVLRKDDWATWLQTSSREISGPSVFVQLAQIAGERADQLRTSLKELISKVDILCRRVERLCRLALALVVCSYMGSSTFLNQKRWFLHHTAHPPHQVNPVRLGFGDTGALVLSLSSN